MGFTVTRLATEVRTDADAYRFMEKLRWPEGDAVCPHCDTPGATYIEPKNGVSRKTRTGAESERRVWRCLSCRKQFSVITGTVMHGTKVSLRTWVLVIFEMCASKNGVAAREIERKYGVAARTAWFMMHRIREAMKTDAVIRPFSGVVVADETWIGGRYSNMHKGRRASKIAPTDPNVPVPVVAGERPKMSDGGKSNKTAVLSLIEQATGEARSVVVPDVTGATLRKAIADRTVMADTILYTDEWSGYRVLTDEVSAHETVNHAEDQYARYEGGKVITTNAAESFFAQLKRSVDGTHHRISREHLPRYLAEFDYRHTTRKMTDTDRMLGLMGKVGGKRLTYKRVTAA